MNLKLVLIAVSAAGVALADHNFIVRSKDKTEVMSMPVAAPQSGFPITFEGISSTDFGGNFFTTPPQPQIAAGPDDILTVVNRTIARYPNPTAPGLAIVPNNPVIPSVGLATETIKLDNWIGPTAMGQLCPTTPLTAQSCLVDNATVRYDQMQGRFVVLFTVTNTGIKNNQVVDPRKASWVLIVSRFATVTGSDGTGAFTTPISPATGSGAASSGNWFMYYGNALNGPGTDGFGSSLGSSSIGVGNINSLPGITGSQTKFDCSPGAIAKATTPITPPSTVCYFPTSARLGLDNDNIIITADVLNNNVSLDPNTVAGASTKNTAFSGTRVRVIKKSALYTGQPLVPGNQFATGGFAARSAGSSYDLFTNPAGNGTPITVALVPYTLIADPAAPLNPVFWEPENLRGRALASFDNNSVSTSLSSSQSYLVGAPVGQLFNNIDFVATIRCIFPQVSQYPSLNIPGPFGAIPYYPFLAGNGTINGVDGAPVSGIPKTAFGGVFANPSPVEQAPEKSGATALNLFVGDARPQQVIFREGLIYVASTSDPVSGLTAPTVLYNVIQKTTADASTTQSIPVNVLSTQWYNTTAFAPMFDVPASVVSSGPTSPINVLPFLGNLFVGTTFAPLTPGQSAANGNPGALQSEDGIPITGAGGADTCTSGNSSYPSLWDFRCGEDAYDTATTYRDPATGSLLTQNGKPGGTPQLVVPFGHRGGASTDPNDGSLWLYGEYAKLKNGSTGQWGTFVANSPLTFPLTDPYGNGNHVFDDVPPASSVFPFVQMAHSNGLAVPDLSIGSNSFGPDVPLTQSEMSRWVVLGSMDDKAVTDLLNATGGFTSSFSDVSPSDTNFRYIETMYRRGYTKGCQPAADNSRQFCPGDIVTRGQAAAFIIRAKMSNVFPSSLNGCPSSLPIPQCSTGGDNFGLFVPATPYFSDNPVPTPDAPNDYFLYIQKMRELRIDNGTDHGTVNGSDQFPTNGTFNPGDPLKRSDIVTFVVRAFFL